MILPWVFLVVGLVLLVKGADWLVAGAAALAKRFNISDLAIGLTVVAFGTSMPELVVSTLASWRGSNDIALGNVLGSNSFNILFILGVTGLIYPLGVIGRTVRLEIPLSLLAALMVWVMGNDMWLDGASRNLIGRGDGWVLLAFFAIFLFYVWEIAREPGANVAEELPDVSQLTPGKASLLIVAGLGFLVLGGHGVVEGAVKIAAQLGMSQSLIGLTIVAGGTSLPELATSVVAAYKKNTDIAVGNTVGSNIFNIFFILGISALIRPVTFGAGSNLDVLAVVVASVLLFGAMLVGRKPRMLERWEAAIFLACYISYIAFLLYRESGVPAPVAGG